MGEAAPDPAPGPERDRMVAVADARAARDESELVAVLSGWLAELEGLTSARMRSPRARRGTKWWTPREGEVIEHKGNPPVLDTKAVNPDYVLPQSRVDVLGERIEPVAMRIVRDAAASTAERLGVGDAAVDHGDGAGMFAFDTAELDRAVEDAVAAMLGVGQRHAEALRRAITTADETDESLDQVLNDIAAAHRRGGGWVLLHGRTLANSLRNRAELGTARAAGVTHTQWLSRRDARVRATHVHADGAVRPVGEDFRVGDFALEFPGDPRDLPASWREVAGCRCSLIMAWPDERTRTALHEVEAAAADPEHSANLASQRAHYAAVAPGVPLLDAIDAGAPAVAAITLDAPMVGYRLLPPGPAMTPGQLITVPGPLVLALRAPRDVAGAAVLGVSLPAGTVVGAADGMLVMPSGATLSVVGATEGSVAAIPVAAA